MISESLQRQIQSLEDDGYVILLKWDGERKERRKTVVILRPGTDFSFQMGGYDTESKL